MSAKIIRCPKCGCKKCKRTILGNAEKVGAYAMCTAVGFGCKALLGAITGGWYKPSRVGTKFLREGFKYEYECSNCHKKFHTIDEDIKS